MSKLAKYSIIVFMLLVYINRGFFISSYETENYGNKEVNSIFEWITQLITGECNDIDEDGDLQSDCNSVKIVNTTFYQEFAQYLGFMNLYSKNCEVQIFPNKENLYLKDFYTQIDHPPQV